MIVNEYKHGNVTIVVYRPELDEQEFKKQQDRILVALQQFGKEVKENEKKWQR